MRDGPPGIGELLRTLTELVALVPGQVYLIIDGTDECSDPTPILLAHICDLLSTSESTYAILLGRSRDLQDALAFSATVIEIDSKIIKHEIERFIDTKLQESTIPTLPGDLGDIVSRTLKSNSVGNIAKGCRSGGAENCQL